jgi:hypothetical protein
MKIKQQIFRPQNKNTRNISGRNILYIIILFYIKNLQDLIEKLLFDINRNTVDLEYGEFFDLFEDKFGVKQVVL